ncbi:L-seryl-tRNA(Sec) selenium transferase [Amycolatopsis acidicola]|uniref:L-seryl-tRNA(Sec) selenium transferase n=1 Tax=Amycolatopsis acidicola TaxID=2596893 RepID=UPI001FB67140|nr:L-seryl-tRNA(Sec) selenium transferase [Amycolatopsis acidicola]
MLADPCLATARATLAPEIVKQAVQRALASVRSGEIEPPDVIETVLEALPLDGCSLRPVLNATGVVLHTNLGRAPLSPTAVRALTTAAGYVDVEFDVRTGARARRGRGALDALLARVPRAEDALVLNNGAAALALAATALAVDKEILVSRGELVEIGDGFRLPELLESTGAKLREVGTTNRTHLADYRDAIGPQTAFVLKIHPSNFVVRGFTSEVSVRELSGLGVPVIADIGSGLLAPEPALPAEPDAATWLAQGADLVTASGDKLLGGPQAGLVLGRAELIHTLRRHPLARALRVDKLVLAALEATLAERSTPTADRIRADPEKLRRRAEALADSLVQAGLRCAVVESAGLVGGGGAPELTLPGWAVELPERFAVALRLGDPCVVARVDESRCLLDLRCVPEDQDGALATAVRACM